MLKIDGSLPRNIDFEVANLKARTKTRRKTSILKLQSVKIGGSLARKARFEAPTSMSQVSGFPVASPCLWGKLQNLSFSKVSKQVVMSFCVAGVALYTLHSALYTPHCTLYTPPHSNTLRTPHSTLYTLHSTLYTLHFALSTPPSHSTLYTPHSTIYTLDSTL